MMLIRYIDLYHSYYDDNGEVIDELVKKNLTTPFDYDLRDATTIGPFMTSTGREFKNVSMIEDRYGKTHKVVGNYRELIKLRDNPPRKPIGYGK